MASQPIGSLAAARVVALRRAAARGMVRSVKRTVTLLACWSLVVAGCDEKKSEHAAAGAPAGDEGADPAGDDPAAPSDEGLRVPHVEDKVGDTVTEVTTRIRKFTAEVGAGRTVDVTQTSKQTLVKELVAADGGDGRKLKITYAELSDSQTVDGKTENLYGPLDGKTYLVWRAGGKLKVSREDGSAPSAKEAKQVRQDNANFGKPDPMEGFVSSRTWKVGQQVDATADELATLSAGMGDGRNHLRVASLAMTLQATDGVTATWATTMTMLVRDADDDVTMNLSGTLKIDVPRSHLLELTMHGPFTGSAQGAPRGTVSMKTVNRY